MSDTDQIDKPMVHGHWYTGMPSPNPGGRPKQNARLQDLAREHTDRALNAIVDLMDDAKTSRMTKLACARELLDRGWGKPMITATVTSDDDSVPREVGMFEIARRLSFLLTAGAQEIKENPQLENTTSETP